MAADKGKDLGYHWRRSAGVYDSPDHVGPPGNAHTTTESLGGLGAAQKAEPKETPTKRAAKKA
jgi:hypothetical protein